MRSTNTSGEISRVNFYAAFIPGLRLRLRQYPLVHRPARWVNRSLRPAVGKLAARALRRIIPGVPTRGRPRGLFSECALLSGNPPTIEGGIVLTDQGCPALPSDSIILRCGRNQHREQPWPVFWSRHRNARLIGSSLIHFNARGEMSIEAAYGLKRIQNEPGWSYYTLKPPLQLQGPWTSVIGQWLRNDTANPYAHWLLDALPRLALLKHFPAETRILIPPHLFKAQAESLQLLGVENRCRKTPEQHLRVEDYWFSSPPSMIVCYSPYSVEFLRSTYLPMASNGASTPARFFVRRTSYGRNILNEREVLEYFERVGWTVIDTATLSFIEQIQWFAGAEAVCAIHGSGSANMVWCSPGCKFIELFPAGYLAGDQEWIAQCVKANYHFMIFPSDYKLDASVDLTRVNQKLRALKLI
jgi:Glycosyltransferase 61